MTECGAGRQKRALVIGIGNPILCDDAIGLRLVEDLRRRCPWPGIEYRQECCGGLEILERIQGCELAVFIDAVKTAGGRPGTVYQFDPSAFAAPLHLSNLHDVSFPDALEFGRRIGLSLPEKIVILGVEIEQDLAAGEDLSPALQSKYEEVFCGVRRYLKDALGDGLTRPGFFD